MLPNNFYAGYEALAARLARRSRAPSCPSYVAPQTEIKVTVKAITPEQLSIARPGRIAARRYDVVVSESRRRCSTASVTIDARARLVRLEIPAAGSRLVRSELATVSRRGRSRSAIPTDTDVIIPAPGFTLAGTLTMPPGMGRLRHPAVVLVAGSGLGGPRRGRSPAFRSSRSSRGALAEQGFVVLRYDKRGVGQSGGRSERVTLQDYADDLDRRP